MPTFCLGPFPEKVQPPRRPRRPSFPDSSAQLVKNLPAMQETPVQFLDQKDPLEKGWAPYSCVLGLP